MCDLRIESLKVLEVMPHVATVTVEVLLECCYVFCSYQYENNKVCACVCLCVRVCVVGISRI